MSDKGGPWGWPWALLAGVFFGVGLTLSGMTDPHRVRAFLDVAAWDATLVFVMCGAILAHAPMVWLLRRRGRALEGPLHLPTSTSIGGRLIGGATLFGVGWGLSGYCPGPALMSLLSLSKGAFLFVAAMLLGSRLAAGLRKTA